MAEFNEEIVRRYFERRGYLVRSNVPYWYAPTSGGGGWSDVDLVCVHPTEGEAAVVEVKGWHTEAVTPGTLRAFPELFH